VRDAVARVRAARPVLAESATPFMQMEREVEVEFRPQVQAALQAKIGRAAEAIEGQAPPVCSRCQKPMSCHDARPVSWLSRYGRLRARPQRFRCKPCKQECRPLLDYLGVEPGRISGSLARLLAVLGVVVPYELAAQLAGLVLGVKVSSMSVWRVVQRLGEAAGRYTDALSAYHAEDWETHGEAAAAPDAVVMAVDGSMLGMQVRTTRRHRKSADEVLPPLPKIEEGGFREVKTGVLLLPAERVETSPGRQSAVRRFLVTCLGNADAIFTRLWAKLQEAHWLGPKTVVVIVGDGAEWIWNRATMFVNRCEILDFWHAVECAWKFARAHFGEGSKQGARWVQRLAADLRAGKVEAVIRRLKQLRPQTAEAQQKLEELIRYYTNNVSRMRYEQYIRLGYGIGSGAVESAHKQIVHARMRQAGMRWSEPGARRLLELRLLLLNGNWAHLDQLRMVSPA
jgi:hypothetical protein